MRTNFWSQPEGPDVILLAVAIPIAALGCGASQSAPSRPAAPPASVAAASATPPAPLTEARVADLLRPLEVAPSVHNLIKNPSFEAIKSLPWTTSFTAPASGSAKIVGGVYCLKVTGAGAHSWDAQIRHREMTIVKGHKYAVRFKIGATVPIAVKSRIAMSGPPYKGYWQNGIDLGPEPKVIRSEFTMNDADDPTAEFAFHVGGNAAAKLTPFSVCLDDVVLEDPEFTPRPEQPAAPLPRVLVNQVEYLIRGPKVAVVRSEQPSPVPWQLVDPSGVIAASGTTVVHGPDAMSGDGVHWADFSSFKKPGAGYSLRVGTDASHAFEIGDRAYRKLKYDALGMLYQQRSGIALSMPYAVDPKWAHAAGHPSDKSVPCAPDARCDYSLDVSGGWYDAGDHGKYVVNGGIATWTLLDLYERTKFLGTSLGDFGDGKMNIPENHNGVPDLLDEARWELDFMMKMQVPAGKPLTGMVHHKVHDKEWTALATRPEDDPVPRFLRPVSTAATLNLAATAAQCARVFAGFDKAYSARCLEAAESAWSAAVAHPSMLVSPTDSVGGGPYEDSDVSDEFYWAAAELFITTKKDAYKDFLSKSPHAFTAKIDVDQPSAMTWQRVATLGTISLAVVPNALPEKDVAAARAALVSAAGAFAAMSQTEGYRVPFAPPKATGYPWGSNSFILNNALVLGLAADFTKDKKYVDVVVEAMDYVLGRNPLDQSYVSGYGARRLENPHHRFWAHQANSAFPSPPPGVLSGGPNSGLQDPYVQADGLAGCAPMKCYVDNIEAWSVNEEAINWNAALAWVTAYVDERAAKMRP